MLTALENDLVDLIEASPLNGKLRVGTLPRISPDVIERMATTAPAVYIAWRDLKPDGEECKVTFELLLLARNARGHEAARQGDGLTIGLYEEAATLLALLNGQGWRITGAAAARSAGWEGKGIYAATMTAETNRTMPHEIDAALLATLSDFVTFDADLDIPPFETATEHDKWLAGDQTTSRPDAEDTVTLPQ
jgi:hypothetical protein